MEDNVKYCVTAFIDLLGFSSHLEMSSNDLRTSIGQAAVKRLDCLENSLRFLEDDISKASNYYPTLNKSRINDGIIITMDLPEFLKPRVGMNFKNGISFNEMSENFQVNKYETFEAFDKAYRLKIYDCIKPLMLFVGTVARIHNYINKIENENYFPGAKTVISSGYRHKYTDREGNEDFLAANFSFSNAYLSGQSLHGAKLFIDCYLLQLLNGNLISQNLVKASIFIYEERPFDPFMKSEDILMLNNNQEESKIFNISLFRRNYYFRAINSLKSVYFQLVPFLSKEVLLEARNNSPLKVSFLYLISKNTSKKQAMDVFLVSTNISDEIQGFFDHIVLGKTDNLFQLHSIDLFRPQIVKETSEKDDKV